MVGPAEPTMFLHFTQAKVKLHHMEDRFLLVHPRVGLWRLLHRKRRSPKSEYDISTNSDSLRQESETWGEILEYLQRMGMVRILAEEDILTVEFKHVIDTQAQPEHLAACILHIAERIDRCLASSDLPTR